MALNVTTSDTGSVGYADPTVVDNALILEVRENVLAPYFANMIDISGQPGIAHVFPILTTVPTVETPSNGSTEGAAMTTTTALVVGNPTATAAIKQSGVIQSFITMAAGAVDWANEVPKAIGRSLANKMDVDFMTLLASFTNVAGTSGVDCSLDDLRYATVLHKKAALSGAETSVFCLHPQQWGDVDAQLISGGGASLASMFARVDIADIYGGTPGRGMLSSMRGALWGIPCFSSANISATSTTDYNGALFTPKLAIGGVYKWLGRIESASMGPGFFQAAQAFYGTSCYGFVELNDAQGVSIITDY